MKRYYFKINDSDIIFQDAMTWESAEIYVRAQQNSVLSKIERLYEK